MFPHDSIRENGSIYQVCGINVKRVGKIENTSSEKLFATPGASMALIRERLISAFSASCSCDIPRILRSAAIAMPR